MQAMVMASIGFAFMPEFSVTHSDSVRRPLVDPEVTRTISLITVPGRKHSPPWQPSFVLSGPISGTDSLD